MSIVDSALQKMRREQADRKSARAKAPPQATAMDHTIPTEPSANSAAPVSHRTARLDLATMERNCVLLPNGDRNAARAYKILRTRLLQRFSQQRWNTLAITSTASEQGKTLTAINLAIALAQDAQTHVYLVDLDLVRPQVGQRVGMTFDKGLSDYLLGEADLQEIIYETDIPRLAIVPNAVSVENSSELMSLPRMTEMLDFFERSVPRRIVIFDMPPLMMSDDVLAFAPSVDSVMLIATEGMTTRASLEKAKEVLSEMNLVGVVLNRSAERSPTSADYY